MSCASKISSLDVTQRLNANKSSPRERKGFTIYVLPHSSIPEEDIPCILSKWISLKTMEHSRKHAIVTDLHQFHSICPPETSHNPSGSVTCWSNFAISHWAGPASSSCVGSFSTPRLAPPLWRVRWGLGAGPASCAVAGKVWMPYFPGKLWEVHGGMTNDKKSWEKQENWWNNMSKEEILFMGRSEKKTRRKI